MSEKSLRILVISEYDGTNANVIRDFLFSFNAYSRHTYLYVFRGFVIDSEFDFSPFDVILIFWSTWIFAPFSITDQAIEKMRASRAVKALFLQDEYRGVNYVNEFMRKAGIQIMFTCVAEEDHESFYPRNKIPGLIATYTVLTGYVPEYLENPNIFYEGPRKIDIGYRSREQPYHLGDLAHEKMIIAERFIEISARYGFSCDISVNEEDRIYGINWIRFLKECRFILGTASGASVIDFTGEIRRNCDEYLKRNPYATYEEVKGNFFAEVDGKLVIEAISPRIFESVAIGNILVNHEGNYSGILEPDRHYICIKRDYSNIDEVIEKMKDRSFCQKLMDNAYDDLIKSKRYSYRDFIQWFDRTIEKHVPELIHTAHITHSAFYKRNFKSHGQYIIPYRDRFTVYPCWNGLAFQISRIFSEMFYKFPIELIQKRIVALRLVLSYPWLRRILLTYIGNKRIRAKVKFDKILWDLLKLGVLWQAQSSNLTCGHLFRVTYRYDREDGCFTFKGKCIENLQPEDFKDTYYSNTDSTLIENFSDISYKLTNNLLREIIWDHLSVHIFFPYTWTKEKWVYFRPDCDKLYHLTALIEASKIRPDLIHKALYLTITGGREKPKVISFGYLIELIKKPEITINFIRNVFLRLERIIEAIPSPVKTYFTFKVALSDPYMKDLFIKYFKNSSARKKIKPRQLLNDFIRIRFLKSSKNGDPENNEYFKILLQGFPEERKILFISKRNKTHCDIENMHDESNELRSCDDIDSVLTEFPINSISWDHSAVGNLFKYPVSETKNLEFIFGTKGVYHFDGLTSIMKYFPEETTLVLKTLKT